MYNTILWTIPVLIIVALIVLGLRAATSEGGAKSIIGLSITAVVVVTLTAAVIIPAIDNFDYNGDNSTYYDDYFETDAVSASGTLEIVSGEGYKWAHAIGIGNGTLTYADGHTDTVAVKKAKLDVFVLTGQSNAAYYNPARYDPATAAPIPALGDAYYYGTETAPVAYVDNFTPDSTFGLFQMTNLDGSAKIGNIELPFAGQYTKETGHKVLVVNGARSGTSITTLIPGGNVFGFMQTAFSDATSKISDQYYTVSYKGYMWIQGETDKNMDVSLYKQYFLDIYRSLSGQDLAHVFSEHALPICAISKVRAVDGTNPSAAQIELAEENAGIYLATSISDQFTISNGLMISDNVHYSQLGDNAIGKAFAKFFGTKNFSAVIDNLVTGTYYNSNQAFWTLDYEAIPQTHTITIADAKLTIDDRKYDMNDLPNFADVVYASDKMMFYVGNGSHNGYIMKATGGIEIVANPADGTTLNMIIAGSTVTYSINSGDPVVVENNSWCYIPSNDGAYIKTMLPGYVNSTDEVYSGIFASGSYCHIKDGVCHAGLNLSANFSITTENADAKGSVLKVTAIDIIGGTNAKMTIVPFKVEIAA